MFSLPGILSNGPTSLGALLDNVLVFLMYVVGVVGVVMITYSGFAYVTSLGRPDKTKKALFSIIYTAIGFAIAIMARAIVDFFVSSKALNACQQSVTSSGSNSFTQTGICNNVSGVITNGLSIFTWVIGISAVIVIIISGMLYIYSTGDPGKTKAAKDAILYAAVGLVIALVAGAGIAFVNSFLR